MLWLAHSSLASHPPSPCPDIFDYEGSEPENNRWYGEISLRTDESLVGIRLDIELDRPSDLMVVSLYLFLSLSKRRIPTYALIYENYFLTISHACVVMRLKHFDLVEKRRMEELQRYYYV